MTVQAHCEAKEFGQAANQSKNASGLAQHFELRAAFPSPCCRRAAQVKSGAEPVVPSAYGSLAMPARCCLLNHSLLSPSRGQLRNKNEALADRTACEDQQYVCDISSGGYAVIIVEVRAQEAAHPTRGRCVPG